LPWAWAKVVASSRPASAPSSRCSCPAACFHAPARKAFAQADAERWSLTQAGVRRVCFIDPARRHAVVYSSPTDVVRLGPDDALDGEDVVPGFRCRLADVLD
jgi:hypothetical protein